ncbi:hypothetical protein FRC12_001385 [Ceratobasidium sp. 428]|nr:hypothetical protein FRC12_001385 [Ceratobasidium sp. 428]
MSARKSTRVDPEIIASSRQRREKAGIRQNPDGTVHNANAACAARIAKDEQASAAAEIEASPFTGDDSLAHEPLLTFTHPTPTGKIFKDEEAAAEYLTKETQSKEPPVPDSKGKGKVATTPNSADQVQEPSGYAGISIDSQSQAVTAKYAPKSTPYQSASVQGTKQPLSAEQNDNARKIQRAAPPTNTKSNSSSPGRSNPLRRSDSTTVLFGERLKHPVYYSGCQFRPNPSPALNNSNATGNPARQASAAQRPSTSGDASRCVVSSPAHSGKSCGGN